MILYDNTGVTVELDDIIRSGVDIWDFDYPVPREKVEYNGKVALVPFSKKGLEQKIIDHYRFRQIGQETVGRWLHYFRTRMREIMPYYVQLYEFEAKWWNIDDPLESYNLTETFDQQTTDNGTTSNETSSETSGTSNRNGSTDKDTEGTRNLTQEKESSGRVEGSEQKTHKFSDTPQGTIDNLDSYMSEASRDELTRTEDTQGGETTTDTETTTGTETTTNTEKVTDTGTSSGTSETTSENAGTVRHTLNRRGNIGVQPLGQEVNNIRSAFINIDKMVIDEFKDLFIMVY